MLRKYFRKNKITHDPNVSPQSKSTFIIAKIDLKFSKIFQPVSRFCWIREEKGNSKRTDGILHIWDSQRPKIPSPDSVQRFYWRLFDGDEDQQRLDYWRSCLYHGRLPRGRNWNVINHLEMDLSLPHTISLCSGEIQRGDRACPGVRQEVWDVSFKNQSLHPFRQHWGLACCQSSSYIIDARAH